MDLADVLLSRMDRLETAVHARLADIETASHQKLDALLKGVHVILSKGTATVDHAELLTLVNATETKIETMVNEAVAEFETLKASHTETVSATQDALDDIGAIVASWPDKVAAKLAAMTSSSSTDTTGTASTATDTTVAATSTVTVTQPTTAPAGLITVTGDVATGSTISGPGVDATATAVSAGPAVGQTTVTLSTPTSADHTGGETLTVTAPAAAS